MKHTNRRYLSILLALILMLSVLSVTAVAAENLNDEMGGIVGDGILVPDGAVSDPDVLIPDGAVSNPDVLIPGGAVSDSNDIPIPGGAPGEIPSEGGIVILPTTAETFKQFQESYFEADKLWIIEGNVSYEGYVDFLLDQRELHLDPSVSGYAELESWIYAYANRVYGRGGGHVHVWNPAFTRTSHFLLCSCEERKNVQSHIHGEATCPCGYEFLDNAQLTTLYLEGMTLDQPFDPEVTEYTATPVSYKDVTKTRITAFPFDALATVKISEDLTVKEGTNTYTVEVTAEDSTSTKTYTIMVTK